MARRGVFPHLGPRDFPISDGSKISFTAGGDPLSTNRPEPRYDLDRPGEIWTKVGLADGDAYPRLGVFPITIFADRAIRLGDTLMFQRTVDAPGGGETLAFLRDGTADFRMTVTSLREDSEGSPQILYGPGSARIRVGKDVEGTIVWKVTSWGAGGL